MTIGSFITITRPFARGDTYSECLVSAYGFSDRVALIDGEVTWPNEFDWPVIGQHFQKGYEALNTDWVFHLDTDFIFHENDYAAIRAACEANPEAPALSFWKHQFILPDRYNLKSRLVLAVNKGKYGNRIRFDSGGDLCQPSLDGKYISPDDVPEARVAFWNYEKIIKTEDQLAHDAGRMERAWHRSFGVYQMGSDGTDASALEAYLKLVEGRFRKPQEHVKVEDHPKVMRATIELLTPDNFGYSGFGRLGNNDYVRS